MSSFHYILSWFSCIFFCFFQWKEVDIKEREILLLNKIECVFSLFVWKRPAELVTSMRSVPSTDWFPDDTQIMFWSNGLEHNLDVSISFITSGDIEPEVKKREIGFESKRY